MDFLPVFLDIKDKSALVVGGGEVAARKVSLLLQAQAQVRVIALAICPNLKTLSEDGAIKYEQREYQDKDLDGCSLVYAATDNPEVNRRVSDSAKSRLLPVNVVDQPELCSFITPSIVDRSPVVVAVSTGGASPVLARLIRSRLESVIPAGYGRLADLASRFRDRVKQRFSNPKDRQMFWENVLRSGVAERVFSGHTEEADVAMEKALEIVRTPMVSNG